MSDSHEMDQHETEHVAMTQVMLQIWQSNKALGQWIFISFDESGHPIITSSFPDTVLLHRLLRQIGESGDEMIADTTETTLESKQ